MDGRGSEGLLEQKSLPVISEIKHTPHYKANVILKSLSGLSIVFVRLLVISV